MSEFKLYHYDPSFVAALIFVVLFAASSLGHLYQLLRFRTWYFIPFFIGCAFETVGYVGRAISAKQTPDWTLLPYVMQSLLLLLGPTLLAASIYMVLARLIMLLEASSYSLINTKILTKVFVLGDVISFLAQSGGGGILANAKTSSDQEKGRNIIIVGLLVQIIFFGSFIIILHVFHRRIIAQPTQRSLSLMVPWKRFIMVLYVISAFIMVRSAYRVLEYITGTDGKLQSNEAYLYIFDASLVCLTTVLLLIFHPNQLGFPGKGDFESLHDVYAENISLRTA
ncbi:Rta1 domain-containing protein [Fusarium sp. LHS14.1]|nr:Rta1 domain-containing protein [Fusarium sp. LHS14.1]